MLDIITIHIHCFCILLNEILHFSFTSFRPCDQTLLKIFNFFPSIIEFCNSVNFRDLLIDLSRVKTVQIQDTLNSILTQIIGILGLVSYVSHYILNSSDSINYIHFRVRDLILVGQGFTPSRVGIYSQQGRDSIQVFNPGLLGSRMRIYSAYKSAKKVEDLFYRYTLNFDQTPGFLQMD